MLMSEPIFGRDVQEGSPRGPRENEAGEQATFLMEMAASLSTYGSPADRVEDVMEYCARDMGLAGQFFSLPTAVYATLGEGWDARTYLRRVPIVSVNLSRLVALDGIMQSVAAHTMTVRDATIAMREVERTPRPFGIRWAIGASAVCSGSIAPLFGGGLREVIGATAIGGIVILLEQIGKVRPEARRVLDFLAGLVAAVIAAAITGLLGPIATQAVIISGLIGLMPGLTVTMAMKELSTVNLVAGTSRLVGALMILVSIAFGVAVGQRIGAHIPAVAGEIGPALPVWVEHVALLLGASTLAILFQARPRDIPAMVATGAIGYYGAVASGLALGEEIGACVGAFLVGVTSNLFARIVNRPAAVTMVPGIILLVPGSVGYVSISAFMSDNAMAGVETAFRMILIAAALATGLLLANVAAPPKRAL